MFLKESYDVVVVGAGPAGSSTAEHCAKLGLSTLLLEKRQEIGAPKRCGEGVSFDTEEALGAKIPTRCIAQKITNTLVHAPNGKTVSITIPGYGGYVVERKVFDKWRAFQASRAGAYVQAKTEVTDIIKEDDYVKGVKCNFEGEEFEIKCTVLVAADGVESTISRKVGLNTTNKLTDIDPGFQYEMSNLKMKDPQQIQVWFGPDIAPKGYIWIFPKGNDVANVGIGIGVTEKSAKYYLDKFINNNPEIFKDASIIEVNSGGIPVGGFLKNMVMNGFLVVGDAAHQVNPIHGGGMKEGTIAGKMAAQVIKEAIDKDDVSQSSLEKYNKIWWDARGEKLRKVEKLKQVIEKLSNDEFNLMAESFTGDVLVEFSRGAKLSALAKLLMKKPSLITLARHLL